MPNQEIAVTWLKARRERAFRLLAAREHSLAELHAKLTRLTKKEQEQPSLLPEQSVRNELIDKLIEELLEQNFVSNERFIASLSNKILRQGKGPLAFKLACQEHQLENHLIADTSAKLEQLWPEQLARVVEKKFGSSLPTNPKDQAKVYRFLASRGFTPSQISQLF